MPAMRPMFRDALFEFKNNANVKPLTEMLFGYALGGAALNAVRSYIFKREREEKDFWPNLFNSWNAMGTFGLTGQLSQDIMWGHRLHRTSLISVPMWDWYTGILYGSYDQIVGGMDNAGYIALAKGTPIINIIDAQMRGPAWQKRNNKTRSKQGSNIYKF